MAYGLILRLRSGSYPIAPSTTLRAMAHLRRRCAGRQDRSRIFLQYHSLCECIQSVVINNAWLIFLYTKCFADWTNLRMCVKNIKCQVHHFKCFSGGPTRLKPCSFLNSSCCSSVIFFATPSLIFLKNSSIFPAG